MLEVGVRMALACVLVCQSTIEPMIGHMKTHGHRGTDDLDSGISAISRRIATVLSIDAPPHRYARAGSSACC